MGTGASGCGGGDGGVPVDGVEVVWLVGFVVFIYMYIMNGRYE